MRSSRRSWRSVPTSPLGLAALLGSSALLALSVAACGFGQPAERITIHDAWIREPMGGMTAGYLVIENLTGQADVLQSVLIPFDTTVTLHRTTTDASGMSGMEPVDEIHVPAGGTVTLEPGGFHLMIDGLSAVAVGDKVELHLIFETAGEIIVQAEIRAG